MAEASFIASSELERELVERARTDQVAFEQLYDLYFPQVYAYVVKRLRHREATEDLVSVVFMKIVANFPRYTRRECSFKAWVFKIATNCLIDYYRYAAHRPEMLVDELPEKIDSRPTPLGEVLQEERAWLVRKTLLEISVKYQRIIQLKFFSELSNAEIAEVLNLSVNNVGVLLCRALKKFKEEYKKYE